MKAVVVREFSDFDKAEFGELPDPVPGPGEVVVDLEASEVNFPDTLYIEGKYQKPLTFPFSPGLAGAGRISALGEDVDADLLGQRVLVLPDHGTYAEKVTAPAGYCFPLPDEMSCEEAASLGLVYQTAWFALTDRAGFQKGDNVLVLGATGGIGMASLQLAKALGAGTVIAATRGAAGAELARELGADAIVDTSTDNIREHLRDAVREITGGHGADVVIDPVGGDLSAAALRTLAWQGRLVVVGFSSGDIPKFAGNYLLVKNISVSGIQWTDYRARHLDRVHDAQARLFELWREGRVAPRITATFPLDRYADALAGFKSGSASGKTILLTRSSSES